MEFLYANDQQKYRTDELVMQMKVNLSLSSAISFFSEMVFRAFFIYGYVKLISGLSVLGPAQIMCTSVIIWLFQMGQHLCLPGGRSASLDSDMIGTELYAAYFFIARAKEIFLHLSATCCYTYENNKPMCKYLESLTLQ